VLAQEAEEDPGAMAVTVVEGTATVQSRGQAAQPLAQGADVHEGDIVQTGADSRVEISIANGSTLRIGANARLELRTAPAAGRTFSAKLWLGSVWAKVHKLLQDETFHIETENGVAGVRGTEFMVESGPEAGDNVRVYEGAVEVRDHASSWNHRIEPGRELAFRRGVRPEGPRMFDAAADRNHALMRWVRQRPVMHEKQQREFHRRQKQQREKRERKHRLLDRLRVP
jgi:hypothetical protein